MIVLKRFIILNEVEESSVSGIIKFENFMQKTSFEVKVPLLKKDYTLVLYIANEFIIKKLDIQKFFSLEKEYDLSCFIQAIIIQGKNVIAHGSTNGSNIPYDRLYKEFLKENMTQDEQEIVEPIKSEKNDETSKIEVIKEEEKEVNCESKQTKKEKSFYEKIEKKLDELFLMHEKEELLQEKIKDSVWAKIPTYENDYYVVGIIKEEGRPVVICYGVPGENLENKEINEEGASWFEIENHSGYWMIYQNAEDGSIMQIE